jgi:hypothetical protein
MARTVDQYGNRLGTFTPNTTPTDTEAHLVIDETMLEIADIIGDNIPDFLWDDASTVVAIKAASQIELSFYPEQVTSGRSAYAQLLAKYEAAIGNLEKQVMGATEDSTGAEVTATANTAQWSFPDSSDWLTRRW